MLNALILPARRDPIRRVALLALISPACLLFAATGQPTRAATNLLRNPGFEEVSHDKSSLPNWISRLGSQGSGNVTDREAHAGKQCVAIPANTAVEQRVEGLEPGAYVARCWVKSQAEQPVTLLLEDPARRWAVYTCAEVTVPAGQWVQLEAFCPLDRQGPLVFTVGGTSKDFRFYHGTLGEMKAPILADDCELVRYAPPKAPVLQVWDAKRETNNGAVMLVLGKEAAVEVQSHVFSRMPVFESGQLQGEVSREDGALIVSSSWSSTLSRRAVVTPSPAFRAARCEVVHANDRTGVRVASEKGEHSYTAWVSTRGVVSIEAHGVPQFVVRDCRLRYGLLPSFVGADICYAPQKLPGAKQISLPSTQWFVGLADGNDSMLTVVWDTDTQAVALGLSGEGKERMIDALTIATDKGGFSLAVAQHPQLWHQEALNEDWLGEYVPIGWQRPFPARWMGEFFVTTGRKPSFRMPCMDYSFPVAYTKTRMWGTWFEDWNHYPFYFDGPRTVLHFEKTFVPNGDALFYFLEPAAADVVSPCEVVEEVLGTAKAAALFDFDGVGMRKLKYSTPNEFMYDRPVCATTTRLSHIKQADKPTVGVNLATHLYEFVRGIRGRVDQYVAFFDQMQGYFDNEQKAHPALQPYLAELQALVAEAQSKAPDIYAMPLSTVESRIESMKKLLLEGTEDGFNCGSLDVRGPAGAQDDLCRRYCRTVMRLMQTAALKCGDSPEQAAVAKHIWDESRKVLRQPTRWESRRTLYFFDP